jgi:hypothetical protein
MNDFSLNIPLIIVLAYATYFYGIYVGKQEIIKTTKYGSQKIKAQLGDANKLIDYIEEYNEDVGFRHHIEIYKKKWKK